MTKGGAATAGVAAVGLLLAACNPGGEGVRSEGAASGSPVPKGSLSAVPAPAPAASASGGEQVDVVSLMRDDPKVGDYVKKSLAKPCAADAYPVEVTYASLTGGRAPDVIVNVLTCADSVGIGSYVYRRDGGAPGGYENVFADEQPSVSAAANDGELETSTQAYKAGDKVGYPSGEDVTTYRWADGRFTRHASHYTDYRKTTADGEEPDGGTGSES